MNMFQLVFKNMRQRALGTWLTLLSVVLGVALATAVLIIQRQGERVVAQSDFGYDMIVGPKGGALNLVLNSIYGLGNAQGSIPWRVFTNLSTTERANVRWAVPFMVGDTWQGYRIMGTTPLMFGFDDDLNPVDPARGFNVRPDKPFAFAQGGVFHPQKFQGVVGSEVAARLNMKLGDTFQMEHGGKASDVHEETWTVVGILRPTRTAMDRTLFVPLVSSWAVPEHSDGLAAIAAVQGMSQIDDFEHTAAPSTAPAGEFVVQTSQTAKAPPYTMEGDLIRLRGDASTWKISGAFVRTRGGITFATLDWRINNQLSAMSVNPAEEMRVFFSTFMKGSTWLLLGLAVLVSTVAAISILVSIYNSVSARRREIAILRALGATKERILSIICLEAVLIGLIGGLVGVLLGHGLAAVGSVLLERSTGQALQAWGVGITEFYYLTGVVILSALAGLVPALKAYRTSVADNLVES
jgi:putative ABC transport system permease protein